MVTPSTRPRVPGVRFADRPAHASGQGRLAADSAEQAGPFSFEGLIEQAQVDALKPYRYPDADSDALLTKLDYAAHGQIRFKPELALFAKGPGQFPVTFFHLGSFFAHR